MNRSLREKSAARMAAAQLLYKMSMRGEKLSADALLAEYDTYGEEIADLPPNRAFLKKLLAGVAEHGESLEPWVNKALTGEWKKDRMSPLLLAILRLALFELAHFPNVGAPIIVNEYVTLTGRFFSDAEAGFVNASLNRLAGELRS